MIAVGLDLALVKTGWACGHAAGLIRTDVTASGKPKGIARRRYIADQVEYLIWGAAWQAGIQTPTRASQALVVIEKNFVGRQASTQTGIDLTMLHSIVLDTLAPLRCPIVYVVNSTAKKHLAGKGGASKDEMVAAARACGYQGHQEDESDAWGLALIGRHLLGETEFSTPHRQSCLAAVEWVVPMPEMAK